MIVSWSDTTLRYGELSKLPDVSSASQVAMIQQAEAMVTGRLASRFTPPFSSNNLTVADLTIDAVFIQTQMTRQPDKAKSLLNWFNDRVGDLLSGAAQMVTSSGEIAATTNGEPVWSSTEDDHPVFGMSHPLNWEVSSSMQIAEDEARGHIPGDAS